MRLTLLKIRERVRDWLDDPYGSEFDDTQLNRTINTAYEDVVNDIDAAPLPWSIQEADDAYTLTTSPTVREYEMPGARKINEVSEPLGDSRFRSIRVCDYSKRDDTLESGVYIFRGGANGRWFVGVVGMPPAWSTLTVAYTLPLPELSANNAVPTLIPDEFHQLLTYRAALLSKAQKNREVDGVLALYRETMERFRIHLSKPSEMFRSRRLG